MWSPFSFYLFFLIYHTSASFVNENLGNLFYYPLYDTPIEMTLYTFGSWNWIHMMLYVAGIMMNQKFDEWWYDQIVGSSMIMYLVHYPLVTIAARIFVMHLDIHIAWYMVLLFIVTELLFVILWTIVY